MPPEALHLRKQETTYFAFLPASLGHHPWLEATLQRAHTLAQLLSEAELGPLGKETGVWLFQTQDTSRVVAFGKSLSLFRSVMSSPS